MTMDSILMPLLGGVLIGLASSALLLFTGRIAGISGIMDGAMRPVTGEWGWRCWFLAGLVGGGLAIYAVAPGAMAVEVHRSWGLLLAGGVLVGFGTRLGSGCTSGHGVCGISRLSVRSWVATGVFTASGAATVFVLGHLLAGG